MSDTASLKIAINTSEVKTANQELDKLSKTSGKAETQTNHLSKSFLSLSNVLGTVGVGALTAEFIKIADEMNLLDARLKMVSASTAEYTAQKKELLGISKETYSSIAEITTLYTKLDPALKSLGATTKDVNNITESFAKGLKLGGANTVEAASATLQFAQAMGSGVLRGEEFNAIAEASPKLMKYLAEGLGVPQTALRKMAMEGELSAGRVSAALLKMTAKINEDFTQIPLTVGMATTNLKTDLAVAIEQFDKTTGATKALAETISGLSADLTGYTGDISDFYIEVAKFIKDHNDALRITIGLVGGVATAYYGFIAGGVVVKGIQGITTATLGLRAAMIALQASSPILLGISVALGVATAAYLSHDDALEKKNYSTINSIDKLVKSHDDLLKKRQEIQSDKFALDKTQKKETAIVDGELKKIENRLNSLGKARSDNVEKSKKEAEELIKSAKTLEENAKKLAPPTKEKKAKKTEAQKEAEQLAKEQAETEMFWSHEVNQSILSNISKTTLESQKLYEDMNSALTASNQAVADANLKTVENLATRMREALDPTAFNEAMDELRSTMTLDNDILSGWNDFGANLDGVAGKIGNVAKTISDMSKNNAKFFQKDIDITKKYAKAFESANGDVMQEKEATSEYDNQQGKLREEMLSSEIAGYASLAGIMASSFEQGSAGAVAFTALQSALGIASSWTAIANAWALPYPANIPAVAAVTSAVLPIIAQLGGSSGGAGSSAPTFDDIAEMKIKNIESNYAPMTDRLDKQIELLDSIDKNGSAQALNVKSSGLTFQKDMKVLIETAFKSVAGGGSLRLNAPKSVGEAVNSSLDFEAYTNDRTLNKKALRNIDNFIAFATEIASYTDAFKGLTQAKRELDLQKFTTEVQSVVSDFALSMVESVNEMIDAKYSFKSIFDEITGIAKYATLDLQNAMSEVDSLTKGTSLQTFLSRSISAINEVESAMGESLDTILDGTLGNFDQQVEATMLLQDKLGITFQNGIEDALDFIDSIELVGGALATSTANIASFFESNMTDMQNAELMAWKSGNQLATTVDGLSGLFNQLAYDSDGLTDSDLALLNANQGLLESTEIYDEQIKGLDGTLQDTTKSLSTLNSVLSTISSTIEKLRSASRTSEQSLQLFYTSMAEAQALSTGSDFEAYSKAISKAADYSSALFNKDNFALTRDMEYAQLVAANQFEGLQDTTLTQVDYLKQIEENTRTQIDVLRAAMERMGSDISTSLTKSAQSYATVEGTKQLTTEAKAKEAELLASVEAAKNSALAAESALNLAKEALGTTATAGLYDASFVEAIKNLGNVGTSLSATEAGDKYAQLLALSTALGTGATLSQQELANKIIPYLESQLSAQQNVNAASDSLFIASETAKQLEASVAVALTELNNTLTSTISTITNAPLGGTATAVSGGISTISGLEATIAGVTSPDTTTTTTLSAGQALAEKVAALSGFGASLSKAEALAGGLTAAEYTTLNKLDASWSIKAGDISTLISKLQSFDVGTPNVPYDMIAQIHKGEMIVPKPEAEAWRNGSLAGNNNALIAEIQSLRTDVTNLLKVNNSYQEKLDRNTKPNLFQGVV